MADLTRANRVAVKAVEVGYKADFYRTHKLIKSIDSVETAWEIPEDSTKTGERESFRDYVVKNAETFGISWDPADKRAQENVRRPKYDTDESLTSDALGMAIPEIKGLVEKCKYPIGWGGISCEDISPMKQSCKGTDLAGLGIVDGKYEKSGNWAWAELKVMATLKYKGEEVYMPLKMQLVSGQLKKIGLGITAFNDMVKDEIVGAALATADELDPPKPEKPSKASKAEDETMVELKAEEEPEIEEVEADEVQIEIVPNEADAPIINDEPKKRSRGRGKRKEAEETAE